MQALQPIRAGMTISYFIDTPDKPLFGVVQHVGLSAAALGTLWVHALDHMRNPTLIQVNVSHVLRIFTSGGNNL